jgi:hypothetical protein
MDPAPQPEPPKKRTSRPAWAPVAAAAGLVLALLGFAKLSGVFDADEHAPSSADPEDDKGHVAAEELRAQAAVALESGQWQHALELVDEAKKLDPRGDDAPGVEDVRRIAHRKMEESEPAAPK